MRIKLLGVCHLVKSNQEFKHSSLSCLEKYACGGDQTDPILYCKWA